MVQFDQNLSQFFFIVVEIRPLMSDLKRFDKTLDVFQVKMSLDVKIRLSMFDKTLNSTFDVR